MRSSLLVLIKGFYIRIFMTFNIPVSWTTRGIAQVNAETFNEAVSMVEKMIDATSTIEIKRNLSPMKSVATIPWSYEVDIDACDVYQTPEALKEMEKDFI